MQELLLVQMSLYPLIVFPTKYLLLLFLQYPAGVPTLFENILDGFESLLRSNWDHGGHGLVGGSEGVGRGRRLFSRESSSRGVKDSETSTSRVLARKRDDEEGGRALRDKRSMIDTMSVES